MRVTVYLNGGRYDEINLAASAFDLDPIMEREACCPIDTPTSSGNALLCTNPYEAELIRLNRKRIAAQISSAITEHLLRAFGAHDLEDGYPINRPAEGGAKQ